MTTSYPFQKKSLVTLLTLCLSFSFFNMAFAAETKSTRSFGSIQKEFTEQSRKNYVEQSKSGLPSDQLLGKATGKTRTEIQALKQKQALSKEKPNKSLGLV